jgi:hypothetical protein
MKLLKILAKVNGVVFGKTEEGNVVFKQDGGKVVSTGWFEYDEDGWYMTVASNNPDGADVEFFGGTAESVASAFAEVK